MRYNVIMLLSIFLFIATTYSCRKETQAEIDQKAIEQYIADHGIDATKHESGLWYQIINAGGATHPNVNSRVSVDYSGYLLDGTNFDSGEKVSFILGQTIVGWQIGLPLIGEGGEILLIIPSNLGYGDHESGSVPKNSVMVFRVKLHFVS